MKRLPKIAVVLLFAVYFCAGFVIVFKLMTPYIEAQNTISVENNPPPDYDVLAFHADKVTIVSLGGIEEFGRQNPGFSFLVAKGKEKDYVKQLNWLVENVKFSLEVEQLSEDRQLIRVSSDDIRSVVTNVYEATDKEVFPKTFTHQNMRQTLYKFFPSLIGGLFTSLIFLFIHRKYLAR